MPGARQVAAATGNPGPQLTPVYGGVPPLMAMVAVPLLMPQFASVLDTVAVTGVG